MIAALSNVRSTWQRFSRPLVEPATLLTTPALPPAPPRATRAPLGVAAALSVPQSEAWGAPPVHVAYEALRRRYGDLTAIPAGEIQRVVDTLPSVGRVESEKALVTLLGKRLCPVIGGGTAPLELAMPATPSWAAHVFRVRRDGHTAAVLKIFSAPLDGFLRELTAMALIARHPDPRVRGVAVLACGRAIVGDTPYAYLLMEAPGDLDLEASAPPTVDSPTFADYLGKLRQVGVIMSTLHGTFPRSNAAQAIAAGQAEHPDYVLRMLRPEGPLDDFERRGWLTGAERATFERHVRAAVAAYTNTPPSDLLLGVVHGDCYPANFVVGNHTGDLHVVDVNTLMWSLGPDAPGLKGTSDVRQDIGRFSEALLLQGVRNAMPADAVMRQLEAFQRGYRSTCPSSWLPYLDQHLELFRLRYDAVVFEACLRGNTRKTSEDQVRAFLKLVVQRAASYEPAAKYANVASSLTNVGSPNSRRNLASTGAAWRSSARL